MNLPRAFLSITSRAGTRDADDDADAAIVILAVLVICAMLGHLL